MPAVEGHHLGHAHDLLRVGVEAQPQIVVHRREAALREAADRIDRRATHERGVDRPWAGAQELGRRVQRRIVGWHVRGGAGGSLADVLPAAVGNVRVRFVEGGSELLEAVGAQVVVGIEKGDQAAACVTQTQVARGVGALAILVQHLHARRVRRGKRMQEVAACVGRAVVDHDQFDVAAGLPHYAFHRLAHERRGVVAGHHHADACRDRSGLGFHGADDEGLRRVRRTQLRIRALPAGWRLSNV